MWDPLISHTRPGVPHPQSSAQRLQVSDVPGVWNIRIHTHLVSLGGDLSLNTEFPCFRYASRVWPEVTPDTRIWCLQQGCTVWGFPRGAGSGVRSHRFRLWMPWLLGLWTGDTPPLPLCPAVSRRAPQTDLHAFPSVHKMSPSGKAVETGRSGRGGHHAPLAGLCGLHGCINSFSPRISLWSLSHMPGTAAEEEERFMWLWRVQSVTNWPRCSWAVRSGTTYRAVMRCKAAHLSQDWRKEEGPEPTDCLQLPESSSRKTQPLSCRHPSPSSAPTPGL